MILRCSQLRLPASALDPDTAQISISSCPTTSTYLYTIIVVRYIGKLLLQHTYIRRKLWQTRGLLLLLLFKLSKFPCRWQLLAFVFHRFVFLFSCTKLSHPYTQLFAFPLSLSSFSDRTLCFSSICMCKCLPISFNSHIWPALMENSLQSTVD